MTAIAVTGMVVGAGMGVATAIKAGNDEEEAERKKLSFVKFSFSVITKTFERSLFSNFE